VLYGIENCDQVRKAKHWLKAQTIAFRFHDFRSDGLSENLLAGWITHVPWDALLNKRGLTWRKLEEERRHRIVDQSSAVELMMELPTVIKRPVLQVGNHLLVGFSEPVLKSTFEQIKRPD
jgi:arsenate reductase (glutaredoxin)